jgi:hypothetical protein
VNTSLFQVVTGELVGRKVIEGYEDRTGFIGDKLVTVMPSRVRNTKIAGFRALSGPTEVAEGHPYEESTFEEKHVTTAESKQGRILSINEELLAFDQTGEIDRRARALGFYLRQERERTIVRAVTDADSGSGQYVYRPNGTGEALYATDGSNRNWVGAGNTTSAAFNTAVPLVDWTDLDHVLNYRATEVKDDRVDGTARPIVCPVKQLLVPEKLRGTARSLIHSTEITVTSDDQETRFANPVHGMVEVLSSPFIDEQGGQAVNDWYPGRFREAVRVDRNLAGADVPATGRRRSGVRPRRRAAGEGPLLRRRVGGRHGVRDEGGRGVIARRRLPARPRCRAGRRVD